MAVAPRTGYGQVVGEAAQFEGFAVQLPIQAHRAQTGFAVGQGHQAFAVGLQRCGQAFQQCCAIAALPSVKCLRGQLDYGIELFGRSR
jgi:hypothetical protein